MSLGTNSWGSDCHMAEFTTAPLQRVCVGDEASSIARTRTTKGHGTDSIDECHVDVQVAGNAATFLRISIFIVKIAICETTVYIPYL